MEDMLTMTPDLRAIMSGKTFLQHVKTDFTLAAITASYSASVVSGRSFCREIPALFTRTSM
jgi:hypothetical protein